MSKISKKLKKDSEDADRLELNHNSSSLPIGSNTVETSRGSRKGETGARGSKRRLSNQLLKVGKRRGSRETGGWRGDNSQEKRKKRDKEG